MPRKVNENDVVRTMARIFGGGQDTDISVTGSSSESGKSKPGMKNPMTAAGDLIRGGESGAPVRLAIGADGKILMVVAGLPSWQDAPDTGLTAEEIQDMLATFLVEGSGIDLAYDDVANTLTISATGAASGRYRAWTYEIDGANGWDWVEEDDGTGQMLPVYELLELE